MYVGQIRWRNGDFVWDMSHEAWREDILVEMQEKMEKYLLGWWWFKDEISRYYNCHRGPTSKPGKPYEPWREEELWELETIWRDDKPVFLLGNWFFKSRFFILKKWTYPDSYVGATWYDYYGAGFGQHRDSDTLVRSNFRTAVERLNEIMEEDTPIQKHFYGDLENEPAWCTVRENHWAVGWVEWIAIHESQKTLLRVANEMADYVENEYAILNEEDFSNLEFDEYCESLDTEFGDDERGKEIYHDIAREHDIDESDGPNYEVIYLIKNREGKELARYLASRW